jgi:hypothetical protein
MKPIITHVLETEGGTWMKWPPNHTVLSTVYAIRFADGSEWDCLQGWRPQLVTVNREKLRREFSSMSEERFDQLLRDLSR